MDPDRFMLILRDFGGFHMNNYNRPAVPYNPRVRLVLCSLIGDDDGQSIDRSRDEPGDDPKYKRALTMYRKKNQNRIIRMGTIFFSLGMGF